MYKVITVSPLDADGQPNVFSLEPLRQPGHALTKTASVTLGKITPEAREFFEKYPKSDKKLYVLSNTVSAGEFYGSNDNADYFKEHELNAEDQDVNDPACYGYKAFYRAGVFRHHKNKDPAKSYGRVIYSFYNPRMHRIELIIEIDPDLACRFGHADLVEAIRAGLRLAVSMGCRVAYDQCMHCGKKSKTQSDYCKHLMFERNRVYADGTVAAMYNPKPRFFDISFVVVGGDPLAYSMVKLASGVPMSSAELATDLMAWTTDPLYGVEPKHKVAQRTKLADIIKHVPAEAVHAISGVEEALPPLSLSGLAREGRLRPVTETLSALASMGVMLRPPEFQALTMGAPGFGCPVHKIIDMIERGDVFSPAPSTRVIRITIRARPSVADPALAASLLDRVPTPSNLLDAIAQARFGQPMQKVAAVRPLPDDLAGIGEVYTAYQAGFLRAISDGGAPFESHGLSKLATRLAGDDHAALEKYSTLYGANMALALPAALLYGAAAKEEAQVTGAELRGAGKLVAEHPILAATVLAGVLALAKPAARAALRAL